MKITPLKVSFSKSDIDKITSEIAVVLESGRLTLGEMTERFEKEFATNVQRKYAISSSTGTTALEISLRISDVRDKNVLVPANTNYATVAAVIFAGGKPKLYDGGMYPSLESIREKTDKDSAGIIVVHIGGYITEEVKDIVEFCKSKNLFLLEDAAHAHGASIFGEAAGSFGNSAAFSFFPTKVITSGEGGMLVTDDRTIFEKALILRDQGKDPKSGKNVLLGNSWRMSEFETVVGYHQLKHLSEYVRRRNEIMDFYDSRLSKIPRIGIVKRPKKMVPSGYKYIIKLSSSEERDRVRKELQEKYNVFLGGGVYDLPIHKLPVFEETFKDEEYPLAEDFCSTHLCLPIWSTMTDKEAEYVVECLRKILD